MDFITSLGKALSAFGVPVALLIAVGNALWQSRLQRINLRHNLFEKRFQVYDSIGTFVFKVVSVSTVENVDLQEFTKQVRAAEFLFKPNIVAFMDEVYKKALHLQEMLGKQADLRKRSLELPGPEQVIYQETREWFIKVPFNKMKELFSPYLRLSQR
jgi:hypothetical protein